MGRIERERERKKKKLIWVVLSIETSLEVISERLVKQTNKKGCAFLFFARFCTD